MNLKTNLKRGWTIAAVMSLGLISYSWFGGIESTGLTKTILALDAMLFILALPCSLFAVPVIYSAWFFLELDPAAEGIYLNTVVLGLLGAMQWFWLARFWSPSEPVFQKLSLIEDK